MEYFVEILSLIIVICFFVAVSNLGKIKTLLSNIYYCINAQATNCVDPQISPCCKKKVLKGVTLCPYCGTTFINEE